MVNAERIDLTWENSGTLGSLKTSFESGVYVFVFSGQVKRLIYTGTAKSFSNRWCSHLNEYQIGGRTIWRPDPDEDIYDLMSAPYEKYKDLTRDYKAWLPSGKKNAGYYTPLFAGPDFKDFVARYPLEEYLTNMSVWVCKIEKEQLQKILESKIQKAFGLKFDLKYYTKRVPQNWLGKIEIQDDKILSGYNFHFDVLPDIDPDSQKVMSNL
jgi:hypothetical protein